MDKKTKDYLVSWLRKGTTRYPARRECLKKAKTLYVVDGKVRAKYQCALCREWWDKSKVEVDHKNEVGPFKGDWGDYIERMFCAEENLQVLCVTCHAKKTATFNARLTCSRREDLSWL